MRKRVRFVFSPSAAVVAVAMLACGLADGQARDTPAPARGQPPAATTARNDPGPELARLDALAGQWTVRQSMWPDPARPPVVDRGEATLTPVLGGRHLRQELRIDSPKGAFHGLGYLGFDDAAQRYDSLWMDVNFNGMILAHGRYDPSKNSYELTGTVPDPGHRGAMLALREVLRVRDADHFTFEYYERHDGRERLAVRLEYTRK